MENKLEQLLSNPESLSQIMTIASSLLGSSNSKKQEETDTEQTTYAGEKSEQKALPQSLLKGNAISANQQDKLNFLRAVMPFLGTEHRNSIERAIKISKIANTAKSAISALSAGGEENV